MFGTPIFNNFLIYHGIRKRGYCYQWSEDLLIAIDALRLKSLELHWGEYDPGTWRENNCIVCDRQGQPFKQDYAECWRHLGHLYFGRLPQIGRLTLRTVRMRAVSATEQRDSKISEHNHPVAFQRSVQQRESLASRIRPLGLKCSEFASHVWPKWPLERPSGSHRFESSGAVARRARRERFCRAGRRREQISVSINGNA